MTQESTTMNISLALVKARQVCSVRRAMGHWHIRIPSELADLTSKPESHPCGGYKEAIARCAQATARVALLQKFPSLSNERRCALFRAMYDKQIRDVGSAVELARFGVSYLESLDKA